MQIRMLHDEHTPAVREMWRLCFPEDSSSFVDWYFTNRYSSANALGLFEDGILQANLQMLPYSLRLRGKRLDAPIIVGAATHPRARKRGYMRQLLAASFARMQKRSSVSVLYPFQYGFYHKMGYAVVSERLSCLFPVTALPECADAASRARNIGADDMDKLLQIQSRFYQRFDYAALRSPLWLSWRMREARLDNGHCYIGENDSWYAFSVPKKDSLSLIECAYVSQSALRNMLSLFARQNEVKSISCALPICDAPHDWLDDSRSLCTLEPFLMARVLDVPVLLTGLQVAKDMDVIVHIKSGTPQLPVGGSWRIVSQSGIIQSVTPTESSSAVSLSEQQFSRWVFGRSDACALSFEGVDGVQALGFLPAQHGYFCDMY